MRTTLSRRTLLALAARRFAPDGLHPATATTPHGSDDAHLAWAVALLPKVLERVATGAAVSATLPKACPSSPTSPSTSTRWASA
jgi:hypothetical protein